MTTILTKNQKRTFRMDFMDEDGEPATIIVTIRHDDECGNGHNTFSMTADLYGPVVCRGEPTVVHKMIAGNNVKNTRLWMWGCGCQYDEIAKRFPDLAPYIRWHLCSTDGPLHYIANSLYWAGKNGWCDGKTNSPPNLDHFRSTAVWPEATERTLQMPKGLMAHTLKRRLSKIMSEFQIAVESLGLVY